MHHSRDPITGEKRIPLSNQNQLYLPGKIMHITERYINTQI